MAHCKSDEPLVKLKLGTDDLSNVTVTEERKPLVQLLNTLENFVENSIHSIVQDFFLSNSSMSDHISSIFSLSVHAFHNLTTEIENKGDQLFQRQNKLISLIQCECPDTENKCKHILVQGRHSKMQQQTTPSQSSPLPFVDVLELIKKFQNHFSDVLKTQRKVFDYAHCACPEKKGCMARSQLDLSKNDEEVTRKVVDTKEDTTRNDRAAETHIRTARQTKGIFSNIFGWFSNFFSKNDNKTFSNGTTFFNSTLPNGAHFTGAEFHNGSSNGYFVATHKNDSNGNFYSSNSAAGGTFFG